MELHAICVSKGLLHRLHVCELDKSVSALGQDVCHFAKGREQFSQVVHGHTVGQPTDIQLVGRGRRLASLPLLEVSWRVRPASLAVRVLLVAILFATVLLTI